MTLTDGMVLLVIILILLAIIFFRFIYPRLKGKKVGHCSSCPVGSDKKIKRSLKAYKKNKDKEKKIE